MKIFWEIHGYPLDLEIFSGIIMMSGLYQYGNKRCIVGNYMGTIFAFINYSTLMPKFMQSTRLFQYKACIPASFSTAEIFVDEMLAITSSINHESEDTDFLADSHCSMKLQKLE
jgi:hypothetical protein